MTKLQAEARFGKLLSDTVPVHYLEFTDEEGYWKPIYDYWFNLIGYGKDDNQP